MQIPTYKQQSVTPQPKNTVMEQPNLAKEQRLAAWGDVVSNGVPKAAMAIDEAYQKEQDFKFGLIKDDMDSNAQQALDGLKDELNKQDPKELFTNGTFEDYTEPYENAMANAKEKSTGKLKGGMKRRADRYWQQLESANRDIARQIYDKAQKEAGAYCAGQDLQAAVADCDQARANESVDNAVGAGYMTWQEGEQAKKDAKYDIYINGVISGKPFEYEKKNGDKELINHQVGIDHDADLKMMEQAREELPNDKYNALKSYVNGLWDVKAKQIANDRGNVYIDYCTKIMNKDPSVTLETIDNDPALDPVNLDGCMVDYRARLRKLWKQMNPSEKTGKGGKGKEKSEKSDGGEPMSEADLKNYLKLLKKRFDVGEINGEDYMRLVKTETDKAPKTYYSASELVYSQYEDITSTLPAQYKSKADDVMKSITEGITRMADGDTVEMANIKDRFMARLLDVIYEYSKDEGRDEKFDEVCKSIIADFSIASLGAVEKLYVDPTKSEVSSLPAALKRLAEFEQHSSKVYYNNFEERNLWTDKKAGEAFERVADVAASSLGEVLGDKVKWDYEKSGDFDHQDPLASIYFTDSKGTDYYIENGKIVDEDGQQVWPVAKKESDSRTEYRPTVKSPTERPRRPESEEDKRRKPK